MARKQRVHKKLQRVNVWRSYSDMMCGLLLLFILVMCIALFQAKKEYAEKLEQEATNKVKEDTYKNALLEKSDTINSMDQVIADLVERLQDQNLTMGDLEAALNEAALLLDEKSITLSEKEDELNAKTLELLGTQEQVDIIIGVKAELIKSLREEFSKKNMDVTIDSDTGALVLSSNVMFGFNESDLTEEGIELLGDVLPTYCKVLLSKKYVDNIAEIIIDGYTDTNGSYTYNLALSQNRSLAVANYLLSIAGDFLSEKKVATLESKLTVNGHSYNNPILDENGEVDDEQSRRVEVKFRLKDEEMVNEIANLMDDISSTVGETEYAEGSSEAVGDDNAGVAEEATGGDTGEVTGEATGEVTGEVELGSDAGEAAQGASDAEVQGTAESNSVSTEAPITGEE